MATFQSSLRTLVQEALPLADLVSRLNRYCCDHSLEGRRFTTSVLAQLDCATGALGYVNAGHNPPAVRRANGEIETLGAGGLPLGIQPDASFESGSVVLAPGDQLLIYTDGVVDARNARGEDYGETRLMELLHGPLPATAAESLGRLLASVDAFTGDVARFDDVTCVFAHYTGAG
jgi:sigma-B regulation protein RsbU (phosphoserine phosphatase)